ncbi:putative efflux protein, MATE family [Rhizobiales bacterium GAS113]|nr:putative efflux protein, MATE family [Rhizobiales bacterium GAS113]SED03130.1 putative efflux protein, MATE family [Rhizobiales bacterium GAS188]
MTGADADAIEAEGNSAVAGAAVKYAPSPAAEPGRSQARFTQGSTMRHVLAMSLASGVGLIAIFLVDFLSLMYVSWLGSTEKTAAVNFASVVLFFLMSFNIALMIAISALASRALGAGDRAQARHFAGSGVVLGALIGLALTIAIMPFTDLILAVLGAKGETANIAHGYLLIVLASNPLLAVGMAYSAVLRASGDARRAMWVTLSGGIATAILDPILIFGFGLDVTGAAISVVLSRVIYVAVGYQGAVARHGLVARPNLAALMRDAGPLARVTLPAMLTNLATPATNAVLTHFMANYGVAAVAASGVIDRVVPLAFGGLFALSSSIGPVLGQNWGARLFPRMHRVLNDALICTLVYVAAMWVLLVLMREGIVATFHFSGQAAELTRFFCLVSGPGWAGIGLLFCANAAFNNLGFPLRATAINWGRATLGTVPFALIGAHYAGPLGVIAATLAAGSLFGIGAFIMAHGAVRTLAKRDAG